MSFFRRLFRKRVRLTGISTPVVGASWEYSVSEPDCADKLLTFLENRRVLYSHLSHKCPKGVIESVSKIRGEVQRLLEGIPRDSRLFELASPIRAATLDFLQYACEDCENPLSCADCTIYEIGCLPALGKYRTKVKSQVRKICKQFNLVVPEVLGRWY